MPNKMTMINQLKKYRLHYVLLLVMLIIFGSVMLAGSRADDKISASIISLDNGYGYEIKVNDKVFIRQEYIPGIKGYNHFNTEAQAQKVADLIVDKLKNNESPTIGADELIKTGVIQHETVN